jgi:hypothetical protein
MLKRLRSRLTYANVASSLALLLALSTGTAYAANTVFSTDIVDGEVKTPDLANLGVTNAKLAANAVGTLKVIDGGITVADIGAGAVRGSELFDGSVDNPDLADNAVSTNKLAG